MSTEDKQQHDEQLDNPASSRDTDYSLDPVGQDNLEGATAATPPEDKPRHQMPSVRIRIVQIIFLILIVATTLLLASWQWDRYNSATGTVQNLSYVLQWPIIGGFFVVAYRKYIQYERELASGEEEPASAAAIAEKSRQKARKRGKITSNKAPIYEIPEDFFPAKSRPNNQEGAEAADDGRANGAAGSGGSSGSDESRRPSAGEDGSGQPSAAPSDSNTVDSSSLPSANPSPGAAKDKHPDNSDTSLPKDDA